MSYRNLNSHEGMRRAVREAFDAGPITDSAQAKLDEAYDAIKALPHSAAVAPGASRRDSSTARRHGHPGQKSGRFSRRIFLVAAAVAVATLLGGGAYAVTQLLLMESNEARFFEGGNLAVYDSMKGGVASMSADIGQSQTAGSTTLVLDTISCDRNIINVFFTMEIEGGIDLEALSIHEGSHEDEWMRLQRLVPGFRYYLSSGGEAIDEGEVRKLDAYREDGKVKCLMRIVPTVSLPEQVEVRIANGFVDGASDASVEGMSFTAGLDLSTVEAPKELGSQDLVFATNQGEKTLSIARLTTSEFGTVLVAENSYVWSADGQSYGLPDNAIHPHSLKITDGEGAILNYVSAGDGLGFSTDAPFFVFELSGSLDEGSAITFTPMLSSMNGREGQPQQNEDPKRNFDITQIGTLLPMSEFGGYELTGWEVEDATVSISLKPYGWVPGTYIEVNPEDESSITLLNGRLGIRYTKWDYATGELVQMTSFYAATDEELKDIHQYTYHSFFGAYYEDTAAAVTLPLA